LFGKNGKVSNKQVPELPEVHTISSDLDTAISGYSIAKAWLSDRYPKVTPEKSLVKDLEGQKITGVSRTAKNILVELANHSTLLIHLGMTGSILLLDPSRKTGKHAHLVLKLQKGDSIKVLAFSDPRMFGKLEILEPGQQKELVKRYGISATEALNYLDSLYELTKKRKTTIKSLLLDQKFIAGLGNIYATEALFLAKIHPQRKVNTLSKEELGTLLRRAGEVLADGIKHRGSTLPDEAYVDIWGNAGSHQNFLKIYLKSACPNCKEKVSYIKIAGRGAYFCPVCQPL